jgi:ATP-dependent protease HslVU (ClpYQ) peptidase subunit
MIILDSILKSLEIILAGAITTNQLPFVLGYTDLLSADQSISAVGSNDGTTNSGTAVTVLAAPLLGHTRIVKFLSIQNSDTVAATVTIRYNDNGTTRIIVKVTLDVGDNLIYTD